MVTVVASTFCTPSLPPTLIYAPSTPVINRDAVKQSLPLMFTALMSFTSTSPRGTPATADRK